MEQMKKNAEIPKKQSISPVKQSTETTPAFVKNQYFTPLTQLVPNSLTSKKFFDAYGAHKGM